MPLATRCPYCNTTFRVVQDQLKLRAGMVRCGACKQIFNGIEHLVRADQAVQPENLPSPAPRQPTESAQAAEPALAAIIATTPNIDAADAAETNVVTHNEALAPVADAQMTPASAVPETEPEISLDLDVPLHDAAPQTIQVAQVTSPSATLSDQTSRDWEQITPPISPTEHTPTPEITPVHMHVQVDSPRIEPSFSIPLSSDHGLDLSPSEPNVDDHSEHLAPIEGKTRYPRQEQDVIASDNEEPSFVKHGRRKQRSDRITRILVSLTSLILLIGLVGQAAYTFRSLIAAQFPQTKPMLVMACGILACRVDFPMQIEMLSIESNELLTLTRNKDTFALSTLLRNRSSLVQNWPSIEFTLTDGNEKVVARRVFMARDYLPSAAELAKGFAPSSEQAVKLYFELNQLKASDYRVFIFYP